MVQFTVNGQPISTEKEKKLMAFLREDLRLTSVKDGCSEGACGACTILVDGKTTRACVLPLSKMEGKSVITTEGLNEREKQVYGYSFAKVGAVQCGFCIPGMVMSAKALIDQNPDPTLTDVKKAIRTNICRCTGYKKIEEAILLAAKYFRENLPVPEEAFEGKLGEDVPRLDAIEKTLGTGLYVDDIEETPDMLYASAVRSKYPRALVKKIDLSAAVAHPDCVKILTAEDVPGSKKIGHLVIDWDVLIPEGQETRYVGDAVVLVVSKKKESLAEIKNLVAIDYEEREPLCSPQDALKEGAPQLHEKGNLLAHELLNRGDAEGAIANAAHVVTYHYSLPFTEHAFMEPECAIAEPDGDGVLIHSGSQGIYDEQREISSMLGLDKELVNSHAMLVGGGFGGKEDMSVQHHAALAAYVLKRKVKVKLSRQESLMIHPKRHAMEIDMTTACDEKGMLLATKALIISDTGAYASLGGPVLQRACTHAAGPYNYQNILIEGKAVYTNNPPAGAFRGFGVTQSAFALECNLTKLAEKVGISPWEIRYRNAIRPGQVLPNGQIADDSTGMEECLKAVRDIYESSDRAGIACSMKNAGLGVGIPDTGRCILSIEKGKVHVRSSAACIGQGLATVELQMVCEATGLSPEDMVVESPDTRRTPNSGTTTASRQTAITGEAVRRSAALLKEALDSGKTLADLEGKEFYGEFVTETDRMGSDKPNPVSHVSYGYAAQVVLLDENGKVERVSAAYDLGQVVNPRAAEGQIEGGVLMGLGYALTEDYPLENGYPKVKYGTLGLWRATDTPPIDVEMIHREFEGLYAYGAKGVGELATIPTAPAAQHAYYRFDGEFRTKLPMENTAYRKKK